jgi:hypothetical protein
MEIHRFKQVWVDSKASRSHTRGGHMRRDPEWKPIQAVADWMETRFMSWRVSRSRIGFTCPNDALEFKMRWG